MTELRIKVSLLIYFLVCAYAHVCVCLLKFMQMEMQNKSQLNTMNFYHVLPSNSSPEYFPTNHASEFSTPVINPYNLQGKWEVALMNISYNSCIYTFDNDVITVDEKCSLETRLKQAQKPVKVMFSLPTSSKIFEAVKEICAEIQVKFKNLLEVKLTAENKYCTWYVKNHDYFVIISQSMKNMFNLFVDVFTPWDTHPANYYPIDGNAAIPTEAEDMFIVLVPLTYNRKDILLKEANEVISAETLRDRFNMRIPKDMASVTFDESTHHFRVYKQNDHHALLYSEDLLVAFAHRQGGLYSKGEQQFWGYYFDRGFKPPWYVSIYNIDVIESEHSPLTKEICLDHQQFRQHCDVIPYLNQKINDDRIVFSCDKANYLHLKITDRNVTVHFDDTLRDIFAFDQNDYSGKGIFSASDEFSLARRIKFLYVYSNVGDMVRVGDTEAPLLAMLPFSFSSGCILKEKIFKSPMYVPMPREHISQIDIVIYDGAGKLVPFVHDSVTTLRLHFRQL